jgi:hypothetical protein
MRTSLPMLLSVLIACAPRSNTPEPSARPGQCDSLARAVRDGAAIPEQEAVLQRRSRIRPAEWARLPATGFVVRFWISAAGRIDTAGATVSTPLTDAQRTLLLGRLAKDRYAPARLRGCAVPTATFRQFVNGTFGAGPPS